MKIALLEDDFIQAQLVTKVVESQGYQCVHFHTGKSLISKLKDVQTVDFNLFILDWELPDFTGKDVVEWIRGNLGYNLPVLFVTSRSAEEDLVMAIEAGADDYIIKPFKNTELAARVHALLRRTNIASNDNSKIIQGIYEIDPQTRTAKINGEIVELAPKEFDLACLFFRNIGRLFSRDAISTAIWNREIPATSRTLDTHLSNVRQKLKINPENGMRIVSSYALGYRLEIIAS